MHQLRPQVLDQLAHRIGDGFDAPELEDFLVYPLDFVGRYDPAVEDTRLVGAAIWFIFFRSRMRYETESAG